MILKPGSCRCCKNGKQTLKKKRLMGGIIEREPNLQCYTVQNPQTILVG